MTQPTENADNSTAPVSSDFLTEAELRELTPEQIRDYREIPSDVMKMARLIITESNATQTERSAAKADKAAAAANYNLAERIRKEVMIAERVVFFDAVEIQWLRDGGLGSRRGSWLTALPVLTPNPARGSVIILPSRHEGYVVSVLVPQSVRTEDSIRDLTCTVVQSTDPAYHPGSPIAVDKAELRRGTTFDLEKALAPLVAEQLIAQQSPDAPKYI